MVAKLRGAYGSYVTSRTSSQYQYINGGGNISNNHILTSFRVV